MKRSLQLAACTHRDARVARIAAIDEFLGRLAILKALLEKLSRSGSALLTAPQTIFQANSLGNHEQSLETSSAQSLRRDELLKPLGVSISTA